MLFPGISFSRKFNWSLETYWNITILLVIFNIFDTIGKYLAHYKFEGVKYATFIVYIRYYLIIQE